MSMRQSLWVVCVAFLLGLSLAAPVFAAEGKAGGSAPEPAEPAAPADKPVGKPADKPAEKSDMAKEAKGTVVSVNAGNKTLIVEADEKGRMTFTVAEPAAKDLAKIKRGDQVTVRYTEDGGKLMAQEVTKG